ncbi:MAG: MmcQ/YjbR family DNA-binding protein [Alphaproteobacteria bacterium]|nr:MmcQ/YjbR family DNA-binding protein [Alphaproteobacteria bacterium]
MTPAAFAKLALAQEGASQGAHGGHPDFRAGGKVFASLGHSGAGSAMVKLTPEQQEMLIAAEPTIFTPASGAWGLRGYTTVRLAVADATTMKSALAMAWKNVTGAPSRRAAKSDGRAAPRSSARGASRA